MLNLIDAIELKQIQVFLRQNANERIKEEVKISLSFNEICSLKLEIWIARQCRLSSLSILALFNYSPNTLSHLVTLANLISQLLPQSAARMAHPHKPICIIRE